MKSKLTWFERIMTAVTFAEANEHTTAKEILSGFGSPADGQQRCKECNAILPKELQGVKANY